MLDDGLIGIFIFVLLAALVAVKQVATGRILDKPEGSLLVQLVNVFNLLFLLIPIEEDRLLSAYQESYAAYQRATKRLVPFVY